MNGQGISADPWADAIGEQQQERERSQHEQMRAAQEAEYAEMGEIVRRNAMENARRQMSFNNLLASAVKFSNGGALPEVVRNYMNRKMGFDGVRTGVLGGGYQPDGGYAFEFANGADGQGNVARQTQTFTPSSLYNMMNMNRVAFDDNDRAAMRKNLLSSGLSEREVETMDAAGRVYGRVADPQHISNMMGGGAGGRQIGGTAGISNGRGVSYNMNLTTGEKTSSGARPGPRARFVGEDDLNGRPYKDPNRPGERYHGHGVSSFSTATWQEDRDEQRYPDGKWTIRESGPDGKVYTNSKTGEDITVKPGENLRDVLARSSSLAKRSGLSLDDRIALEREKTAGRKEVAGLNNETKLKVADIQKALKERGLDISEDKVAELIRHNKATEGLAGAKQSAASAPTFNKAIYERLSAKEDRLLMKDPKTRTKEENEELKRIQAKLRAMEGDDPVEKKPTPAQSVLFGGDTQGGEGQGGGNPKPGAHGAPAPVPKPDAAQGRGRTQKAAQYGLRNDGKTYKGSGWLGELKLANGDVATEYSIGVNIDGKEVDVPSLVPTLTKDEVSQMVNDIIPNGKPVPEGIAKKAADFAKMQIANGMSVWANDGQPSAKERPSKKEIDAELKRREAERVAKSAEESDDEAEIRKAAGGDAEKDESSTTSASTKQPRKSFSSVYDEKRPKYRSVHDLRNDYSKIKDTLHDLGIGSTELYNSLKQVNFFDSSKFEAKDNIAAREIIDKWAKRYSITPDWMSTATSDGKKWDDATESEFKKYFAELHKVIRRCTKASRR